MKVWDSLSAAEQNKIQSYLLRYFINNGMRLENLKETQPLRKILNENTVKSISCYSEQPSIPQLLMSTDWDIYEINVSSTRIIFFLLRFRKYLSCRKPVYGNQAFRRENNTVLQRGRIERVIS